MLRLLAAVFFVTPLAVAAAALPVKYSGTGGMHDRGSGAGASRLPFAAGVDHLLPAAFAKTHPRRATPHISILAPGVVASFLPVLIQFGDTMRAACQTLVSLMLVAGFLPFVYTFGSAWKAGRRLSAVFGRAITAMAIACSAAPTAGIMHVWLFEGKLAAGRLAVIASAWMVYRRNRPTCS
jgi:APA family basic amino acid/polyamine antiporter